METTIVEYEGVSPNFTLDRTFEPCGSALNKHRTENG